MFTTWPHFSTALHTTRSKCENFVWVCKTTRYVKTTLVLVRTSTKSTLDVEGVILEKPYRLFVVQYSWWMIFFLFCYYVATEMCVSGDIPCTKRERFDLYFSKLFDIPCRKWKRVNLYTSVIYLIFLVHVPAYSLFNGICTRLRISSNFRMRKQTFRHTYIVHLRFIFLANIKTLNWYG